MTATIRAELEGIQRINSTEVDRASEHFIVLSLLNQWLENQAYPHAHGVMLDFGCGGQPYKALFAPRITRYIGVDVAAAKGIELDLVIEPDQPVPLEDSSIDTILSTQALEHVYDVQHYIRECHRLLAPDGSLILTVPMQWRLHEVPYDYWRFTRYGVERLLTSNGLAIDSITPCGGMWALIGQIVNAHLAVHQRGGGWLYRCVNRLALWLDKRFPDPEETLLWMCIAKKPDAAHPAIE